LPLKGVFIGYGNYGSKLLKVFDESEEIQWLSVYSPNGNRHTKSTRVKGIGIGEADFVVIASPDPSHLEWLNFLKLQQFNGYVFCEKSPVVNTPQLRELFKIDSDKIYYNFPLLYSNLYKLFESQIKSTSKLEINWGHSFALKEKYLNNWRSNGHLNSYGVGTSLAIHFVHLTLSILGAPKSFFISYHNYSKKGSAPDTVSIDLSFDTNKLVKIACSYAIPETQNIKLDDLEMEFCFEPISLGDESYDFSELLSTDFLPNKFMRFSSPFLDGNSKSVEYFLKCVNSKTNLVQNKDLIYKSLEILFYNKVSS